MKSLKFCKDCKFFNQIDAKCNVFNRPTIIVRPKSDMCGEDAIFFKPKKEKTESLDKTALKPE